MKKIRIVSFLLVILLLCSTVALFSSCSQKDGDVKLSRKIQDVDVKSYTLVYSDSAASVVFKEKMADFAAQLTAVSGKNFIAYSESRTKTAAQDLEILIGATARTESKEALASIKGEGFTVQLFERKIVIVGTTNLLTLQAVEYFCEKYLTPREEQSTVLSIHKSVLLENVAMVNVATEQACNLTLVYDHTLDDVTLNRHGDPQELDENLYDYPYRAAQDISAKISSLTGVKAGNVKLQKDNVEQAGAELLVGIVSRDVARSCLSQLEGGEYGVFVRDGSVVVTAWNDTALLACVTFFLDILNEATVKNTDGTASILMPEGFALTGNSNKNWVTDFPRPTGEGIELYNTLDTANNSLEFLYMGDGVSAEAYNTYCDALKAAGYTVHTENEIEGSLFKTFVDADKKTTLYVAFNAYTHQDGYAYDFEKCIRIVSAPLDSVTLPDAGLLTPNPSYTKKADSAITTLYLESGAVGMSYAVRLEDGRFILFDGGKTRNDIGKYEEQERLWQALVDLHEQANGPLSTSNPIRVAAWVITHSHGDHFRVCANMLEDYGKNGLFQMEYLIGNFPSVSESYNAYGFQHYMNENMASLQRAVSGGFQYITAHTGDKYHLANTTIEVLSTHEDVNPLRIDYFNDTCTVVRFSMTNKDAPSADPTTIMWAGDAYQLQSRFMCAMYGDHLQSDMVQLAHHGNKGCEIPFYDTIAPTVVWWPHIASAAKNYYNPANKSKGWQYEVDSHLIYETPSVKYVYVSDSYNITLYLRKGGPDYENLYNAGVGGAVVYDNYCAMKINQ